MTERDSYYQRVSHYSPARVAPFNEANNRLAQASQTERMLLIERLDLHPGMTVLDTGAGGGYLAEGILAALNGEGTVICMDAAENFVASIPDPLTKLVCGMDAFPISSGSTDRVSNLAGLHHLQRKANFFTEVHRILKPGGLVGVGDVERDTAPARWLNGPVDRMTDIGHDGMFVEAGEFSRLMTDVGFVDVRESHLVFRWYSPSQSDLIAYIKDLFRLGAASAAEISRELYATLNVFTDSKGAALEWELTYATGRKAAASVASS